MLRKRLLNISGKLSSERNANEGRCRSRRRIARGFVGAVILSHALIGCSQPDTRASAALEHRPDVTLATGVVLTEVAVNRSTDKSSPQQTVIHYYYKTPSTRCVDILAEVSELWEKTLRPEAEATGAVQVTMWPESTGYNRDYTRRRGEGGWKANYDAECPPGLR
jgi:hypothetical protein